MSVASCTVFGQLLFIAIIHRIYACASQNRRYIGVRNYDFLLLSPSACKASETQVSFEKLHKLIIFY